MNSTDEGDDEEASSGPIQNDRFNPGGLLFDPDALNKKMRLSFAILAYGLLAAIGTVGQVFGAGSMIILVIGSTLYVRDSRSYEDRRFRYLAVLLGSMTYLAVFGLIGALFND